MSEVDFLLKQLEYCLNSGYSTPARILISELIQLKVKISCQVDMYYKCSSHQMLFKKDFCNENINYFKIFLPCEHSVCGGCIESYTKSIFNRIGLAFNYICPGCSANYSVNPTPFFCNDPWFRYFISSEQQDEWKIQNDLYTMTIKSGLIKIPQSRCYFFKTKNPIMNCPGKERCMEMPNCRHKICKTCIERSFSIGNQTPPFECFLDQCHQILSDDYVQTLLSPESDVAKIILPKLTIEGNKYHACPSCKVVSKIDLFKKDHICVCGTRICPRCGQYFHGDLPCAFADIKKCKFQKIECIADDPILENRSLYYQASSCFLWDLHSKKKAELMTKYDVKFKILKVERIINPVLQEKYEAAKARINSTGIISEELFVFHGTQEQYYDEICMNGFKIGGIDIDINIGAVYGYGVYTATDPTMSIHFYKNKKIIMCRGLVGLGSNAPLKTKEEFLDNKQYHSYFIDFHQKQSNYYVFFDRDYVLPYYLITYE